MKYTSASDGAGVSPAHTGAKTSPKTKSLTDQLVEESKEDREEVESEEDILDRLSGRAILQDGRVRCTWKGRVDGLVETRVRLKYGT